MFILMLLEFKNIWTEHVHVIRLRNDIYIF